MQFQDLKGRIHRKLIDRLDFNRMETEEKDVIREQVRGLVGELADEEQAILNLNDRQRLISEVIDEVFGLGPLEIILKDPVRHRYSHQRTETDLCGATRPTGNHRRAVQG